MRAFGPELFGDRAGAEPLSGAEVEGAAHHGHFHRVGDEDSFLAGEQVAEGRPAAEPSAFLGAPFDAGGNAVDDGGVLELGEHAHIRPAAEPVSNGSVAERSTTP